MRPTRRLLAAGGLMACLCGAPPAAANVVWEAGAERPVEDEWASSSAFPLCDQQPPGTFAQTPRITRSSNIRAIGAYSYRFELTDSDRCYGERVELGHDNPPRAGFENRLFNEGDERYISWQVYLPTTFNANPPVVPGGQADPWQVIAQWKQRGSLGTPALAMAARNGEFRLYKSDTNHDSNNSILLWRAPVAKNRWVKFTLHVKFSPDDRIGFVELYGDPAHGGSIVPLLAKTPTYTMKQKIENGNAVTVPSHSRIGIYRNPNIEGMVDAYYDGYTVATTRAAAETNAFGAVVAPQYPPPTTTQPQPQLPPTPKSTSRPGKCSKLKGKKRKRCVKKRCGKRKGRKKKACIKRVTRRHRSLTLRSLLPCRRVIFCDKNALGATSLYSAEPIDWRS